MIRKRSFLAALIFLAALNIMSLTALAAKPSLKASYPLYATKYNEEEPWEACGIFRIEHFSKKAKILSVKASSKKASAHAVSEDFPAWTGDWKGLISVSSYGLKPGKTFTVQVQVRQAKKNYTLTAKFKIKKRPTPFQTYKINGVEYADRFVGTTTLWLPKETFAGKKVKVSWKLKDFAKNMNGKTIQFLGTEPYGKKIKSGGSVRFTKDGDGDIFAPIRFTDLEMEKTGSIPFKYEVFLR